MEDNKPIIDRERYAYESTRVVDPKTGKVRVSVGNKDALARAMITLDHAGVVKAAKANGIWDRVSKLDGQVNDGLFRMTVGNMLRPLVKKGQAVTVGDYVIKKLDQKEPVIKDAPKAERK